jgi:hypothetical protein
MRKTPLRPLIALALICGASPALGQSSPDPVVSNYVQTYGVSVAEAQRRVSYMQQAADLKAKLSSEEPTRFAGMHIEHQPSFRVVVRLVGGADQLLKRYTNDPVFVAVKAQTPLIALRNKQDAIIRSLSHSVSKLSTDLDVRSGRLKIYVRNAAAARASLAGAAIGTDDTDITQVPQRDELAATILGGEAINGPTQSDGSYEIGTLGFVVTKGSVRGVLTAGHFGECLNAPSSCVKNAPARHSVSGASLVFQAQQNMGSNDYEWRTATGTNTLPNSIRYSNTTMLITSARDPRDFPVGTVVCKQGRTTGYTCGTIESTWSQTTYNGQTGFYVRVRNNTGGIMADFGDSGGPVFGQNTAYGIIHSKIVAPANEAGQMLFMPITVISGLGLSVATQ